MIEQAKGVIAARANVDVGTAFSLLRNSARVSRRLIPEVAADVTAGRLPAAAFTRRDGRVILNVPATKRGRS